MLKLQNDRVVLRKARKLRPNPNAVLLHVAVLRGILGLLDRIRCHDGIPVVEGRYQLEDAAEDEVRRAAKAEDRPGLREGEGSELRHEGKGARQQHDDQLDVVRPLIFRQGGTVGIEEGGRHRLVEDLLQFDDVPDVHLQQLHLRAGGIVALRSVIGGGGRCGGLRGGRYDRRYRFGVHHLALLLLCHVSN